MDANAMSSSIVAPLLIGYGVPHAEYGGQLDAFNRACAAIPTVRVVRQHAVDRRRVEHVEHSREVLSIPGLDGHSHRRARCIDRADGEDVTDAINRWQWEVAYVEHLPDTHPEIDASLTPTLLMVSRFRTHEGGVRAAAQLALFRHMFVQGLRLLSPELVVVGGQHAWDATWWLEEAS
jgi:hypothetical protein